MKSSVMTFSGSVKGQSKSITTLEERLEILSEFGVDEMVVLDFDRIKDMEPKDFLFNILKINLNAKALFAGKDFRFGKGAKGDVDELKAFGKEYDVAVKIFEDKLYEDTNQRISSSWIREALEEGQAELAMGLMGGRPFSYSGIVTKGRQLGRTLGFPTANIEIPEEKITARRGVYASLTHMGRSPYQLTGNRLADMPESGTSASHFSTQSRIFQSSNTGFPDSAHVLPMIQGDKQIRHRL